VICNSRVLSISTEKSSTCPSEIYTCKITVVQCMVVIKLKIWGVGQTLGKGKELILIC